MAIVFRPKDDFSGDYSAGIVPQNTQNTSPQDAQNVPKNTDLTSENNTITVVDQLAQNGAKLANLDQRVSALKLREDAFDKQIKTVGDSFDLSQTQLLGITDRSATALQAATSALNTTGDAQKRVDELKKTLTGLEDDLKAQTDSLKPTAELPKSTGDIQKKIAELRGDIERIKKQIADLEKSLGLPISVTYDPVLATLEPDADIPAPATLSDAGPVLVNPVPPNEATKPNIPSASSTPDIPSNPTGAVSSITPVLPTSVKKVGFDGLISPIIDFEGKKGLSEFGRDIGHSRFGVNDRGKVKFDVKTVEDAKKIYRENYWAGMEDLPEPLAAMALDTAINQGEWGGSLAVVANRLSNGKVGFNKEQRDDLWYDEGKTKNLDSLMEATKELEAMVSDNSLEGSLIPNWFPLNFGNEPFLEIMNRRIAPLVERINDFSLTTAFNELKKKTENIVTRYTGFTSSRPEKQDVQNFKIAINSALSRLKGQISSQSDKAKYDNGDMNYTETKVYKEYEKKKADILGVYNANPEKFLKELAVLREQMYSRAGEEGKENKYFQGWTERNIRNYDFAMSLQKGTPVMPNLNDPVPANKAASVARALNNAKNSKDEQAWFDKVSTEISKVLS